VYTVDLVAGSEEHVRSVAYDPVAQKIYVAGDSVTSNGSQSAFIARFKSTGPVDDGDPQIPYFSIIASSKRLSVYSLLFLSDRRPYLLGRADDAWSIMRLLR
jgi:hypothetical protein